jgi:hypothetical protein
MRDRINFRVMGSAVGTALAGLGTFFLHAELAGAVVQLTDVFGANDSHAIGILPAAILTILQVSHTAGLVQHTLVSCWPLLLVTVGAVLTHNPAKQNNLPPEKKIVDLNVNGSTLE